MARRVSALVHVGLSLAQALNLTLPWYYLRSSRESEKIIDMEMSDDDDDTHMADDSRAQTISAKGRRGEESDAEMDEDGDMKLQLDSAEDMEESDMDAIVENDELDIVDDDDDVLGAEVEIDEALDEVCQLYSCSTHELFSPWHVWLRHNVVLENLIVNINTISYAAQTTRDGAAATLNQAPKSEDQTQTSHRQCNCWTLQY